jgi:hypothetical protein
MYLGKSGVSLRTCTEGVEEQYGPSENKIPVVVNLLHSSSRFLTVSYLERRQYQIELGLRRNSLFRGHGGKTVQITVLAADKWYTGNCYTLGGVVGSTGVIYEG